MDPAVLMLVLLLLLALVSVLGEDTLCPAVLVVLAVLLLLLCAAGVCRTLMRESWKAALGQRLAPPNRCVRRSTAVFPNFEDR